MKPSHTAHSPSLRDVYPTLTDGELDQAADVLDRYISIVIRVHEHLRQHPELLAEFHSLTKPAPAPTMGPKVEPSKLESETLS